MAEDAIESAPTPSIKSLKSRFEQLAQDHTSKPPKSRQQRTRDDSGVQQRELRNALELSPGQKRAPPPPPPSRSAKKPIVSPAVSPLLRPVPVPAALRSPRSSPEHLSVSGQDDDDVPRGGGVASLRERFASAAASPSRASIKPAPRLSLIMTQSEPNVLDSSPPLQSVLSPEDPPSDEYFDASESPRMTGVASLRNRFSPHLSPFHVMTISHLIQNLTFLHPVHQQPSAVLLHHPRPIALLSLTAAMISLRIPHQDTVLSPMTNQRLLRHHYHLHIPFVEAIPAATQTASAVQATA
ncbi:hypothetical protein BDR05DRAFT_804209 [Suillus weaverae]|nr:hypothetical protein BDR05DRAFT_804209 [Suillus weaverae]